MAPETEAKLIAALAVMEQSPARHEKVVSEITGLKLIVTELSGNVQRNEERCSTRHSALLEKLGAHHERLDSLEEIDEVTAQHERDSLVKKATELEAEKKQAGATRLATVVKVAIAFAGAAFSAWLGHAWH